MPETTDTGYEVPTVVELRDRIEAAFLNNLEGENAEAVKIPLTWEWAAVRVLAGLAYVLYRFGAHIAAQVIYDRAAGPVLRRWARMWGVEPITAQKAEGWIQFAGSDGFELPAGETIQRIADGLEYAVITGGTVAGGVVNVKVRAAEVGDDHNAEVGTLVELTTVLAGISGSSGAVIDGAAAGEPELPELMGGTDDETPERLLERLLERIQNTPQGGADADYVLWAREVADVDQVWVYPNEPAAGDVTIRLTVEKASVSSSGLSERIPNAAKLSEVATHLEDTTRKPVTATLYVLAPVEHEVEHTIDLYPKPHAVGLRDAVVAELESLYLREGRPPGAGETATIQNSKIRTAIGNAPGESYHTLDELDGGGPGSGGDNLTLTVGELPVVVSSSVTWVP